MAPKFNFLDTRTKAAKTAVNLRRRFPKSPASWAEQVAESIAAANDDISRELLDPKPFAAKQKGRHHE